MQQPKHYLKDTLPRMYDELIAWLHETERDDLARQAEDMYIIGRCQCGSKWCIDFTLESSNPEFFSINRRRPFFYDITSKAAIMIGMAGDEGAEILTGFECIGDYEDDYIHNTLESIGLIRPPEKTNDT